MDSVLQLFLISGLAILGFLLAGLFLWYRTKRFIDTMHKTTGVVIKVKRISFENRDTFSPVVRFATHDGRALSFTDSVSKYPPEFELGEQTQVFYDPQNPHQARVVKQVSDLFFSAKIFGVAGAALLTIMLLLGMVLNVITNLPASF